MRIETKPIGDLPKEWQPLLEAAVAARQMAHAPYSRFRVGCALEDEEGRVFSGCNIENASYPGATCGERVAVVKMASEGGRKIVRLALITSSSEPCMPCGICLQIIREFAENPLILSVDDSVSRFCIAEFSSLLPYSFSKEKMPNLPMA